MTSRNDPADPTAAEPTAPTRGAPTGADPTAAEPRGAGPTGASRPRRPAGRYRTPPGRRSRTTSVVLAILGLLFAAAVIALGIERTRADVRFGARGFTVLSPAAVRIVFDVEKSPRTAATCFVRARDVRGVDVGRADVPIPARDDGKRRSTVTYDLATTGTANTGEIIRCRTAGDR